MDNILMISSAAVTFVKVILDIIRMAAELPRWATPVLALVLAPLIVYGLMVIDGLARLGPPEIATVALAAVLAAGGAVGVTELQRHAERRS